MKLRERLIVSHRFIAVFLVAMGVALFPLTVGNVLAHSSVSGGGGKKPSVSINVAAISAMGNGAGGAPLNNLIDGNGNTKWMATQLPQDFVLDLGISQKVNSVRIAIAGHRRIGQHRFSVAVSQDGTSWMQVVNNRRFGKARVTRAGFSALNARYVRISLNGVSHKDTLTLRDFEVYGPPSRSPGSRSAGVPVSQQVTLQWSPSSGHVNGYLVYYGPTANMASAQISDLSVSSPGFNPQAPSVQYDTWRDLNALPGDNICFRIRAYGATGLSAWSSAVCSGV